MWQKIKNYLPNLIISALVSILTVIIFITFIFFFFLNNKNSILKSLELNLINSKEIAKRDIPEKNLVREESRIVEVVEKAMPAVVSIVITKEVPIIEQYYQEFNPFNDDFFRDFFGDNGFRFSIPQQRQKGTEKREIGGGSGFFISSDGYIVTNKHVVSDEKAEYTVLTNNGKKLKAEILAKDSNLDVAILKVKGNDFPYLSFDDSDQLKPGQTAIAIGNALASFHNSVSVGVISGLSRSVVAGDIFGKSEYLENVIQTDAAINPGNSGGPLLNLNGKVIGVNVAMSQGAENIGFALTSNAVKSIVDSVKQHGEIVKPYLGIRYIQITESLKEKNNLPVDYGALVLRGENKEELAVIPGSPADKAGIVENDIILEIDGVKLQDGKSLATIIRQKQIGQTIRLKILHKGREKEIEVKLEKAPKNL